MIATELTCLNKVFASMVELAFENVRALESDMIQISLVWFGSSGMEPKGPKSPNHLIFH